MDQFATLNDQIARARIERSVYLGHLIGDFIATAAKKIMVLVNAIGEGSQKRIHGNVFTFDA